MASWNVPGTVTGEWSESITMHDVRQEESRIARAAVALLGGDVAVLHTPTRAVLAAADGVEPAESARQLARPLDALALGYRSQLSVPLWRDGCRVGALSVLGREERGFSDAEITMLRALAGRLDRLRCSMH